MSARKAWTKRLGLWAVIASFPVWFAAFLVAPFLPFSAGTRAALGAACIALGEALFWLGGLAVSAEAMARFRRPKVTTGSSFAGKRVAIFGATGGLGAAVARAVRREGGTPLLLARDASKLEPLRVSLSVDEADTRVVDVRDAVALRDAARALVARGAVHHVVCATGHDVRRPLAAHVDEDVTRTLDVDLLGPIHLTRAFLPVVEDGATIALFGGFGDGGLALPYYSVDVAARAGVAGFCASVNRELELEGQDVRLSYVSPAPADTEAERPFAPVWRAMGTNLVSPEVVADFTLVTLLSRSKVAVMGLSTRLLARLEGALPKLADIAVVRFLGAPLKRAFASAPDRSSSP